MSRPPIPSRLRAVTSTGIRSIDLRRLRRLAALNRMANVDFLSCLMDAWEAMSPDEQTRIIRRQTDEDLAVA